MTNQTRPIALVTGASAGIGEGFATHLARRGYDLVLVARRRQRLDALAGRLGAQGAHVEVIDADLASEDGVSAIADRIAKGDCELLVNNAGFGTAGEFASLAIEREMEEIDVNVRALVRLTHAALQPMVERRRGGVINVASMAAYQPIPYNATYSATKAFVLHFSEAVHEEVRGHGVTVTALCPGPVRTEFQQVAGMNEERLRVAMWESVDSVVQTALEAFKAGRAIAIPGAFNAVSAATVRLAPRMFVRRIAGSMFKNVTEGNPTAR